MFLLIVNKLLCREKFINTLNTFLENLENIQLKIKVIAIIMQIEE